MSGLHPINVIVSSNRSFADSYNSRYGSWFFVSKCMDPGDAADLIDEGAKLNSVVLVDGEGEELVDRMRGDGDWDDEIMPRIMRMSLTSHDEDGVKQVHERLKDEFFADFEMG